MENEFGRFCQFVSFMPDEYEWKKIIQDCIDQFLEWEMQDERDFSDLND